MTDMTDGKKNNIIRWVVIFYFIIYFIVGMNIYKDYGFSVDEAPQWEKSIVTYKYINKRIFHREIPELSGVMDMEEFDHRYYGTAIQMPMVLIEDLFDFTLTTRQVFYMRHIITYLICIAGYICFYFALYKITGNRLLALAGVMIISLYPRLFGYQFTDLKNLIFTSLNMMTFLALVYVVEKETALSLICFGCIAALATNQRVMAVIYPVVLVGYWLVRDITDLVKKRNIKKRWILFGKYPFLTGVYFSFWYFISPFAWMENPAGAFINTFKTFSQYNWDGEMVFMGKIISCGERPWYYLPVWMGVTIPVFYLILFIIGHIAFVCYLKREKNIWDGLIGKYKWLSCSILLFWGITGAVIILNSNIYIGWHHVYFVFVPFSAILVYGLRFLTGYINKKIVGILFGLYMAGMTGWMINNHPFQVVYFNSVGRHFAAQFDRDEQWATCSVLLDWIMDHTEGMVTICGETNNYLLLPEEEKKRIILSDEGEGEYLIDNFRKVIGNDPVHEGYEEVYASWVDGYKIGAVYQRTD